MCSKLSEFIQTPLQIFSVCLWNRQHFKMRLFSQKAPCFRINFLFFENWISESGPIPDLLPVMENRMGEKNTRIKICSYNEI